VTVAVGDELAMSFGGTHYQISRNQDHICDDCTGHMVDCVVVDPHPLFPVLADNRVIMHNGLFDLRFRAEMGFEPGTNGWVLDQILEDVSCTHAAPPPANELTVRLTYRASPSP
jgi:hypothetical protein